PIEVGRQLLVQPSWLEPEPSDRIVLKIDPGMAFGTGTHPTTLLCLQLLEDLIEPGSTLVDLGSGSGILSIAGILLGASRALAYDVSDHAVEATRANAQVNGVSERLVAEKGSLDELLAAMERGLKPDLIVANILAPILEEMLSSGLVSALRPGSMLVLSGILAEQLEGLRSAAVGHDLTVIEERSQSDWHALALKHNPPR
ncbi:MAG: 50S ribosomal protein L11 methyltransferase, partial [Anaerolineales bacterium]